MVQLDESLLNVARHFAFGAHRETVQALIDHYERAVRLHNAGDPEHRIYQHQYEKRLRAFVDSAALPREESAN
jgi:hypothetical protein